MSSRYSIALHVLGFLTCSRGHPVSSEVLATTYGTSAVVVRRVLGRLRDAGPVVTRSGPGGGSVLARDPSAITLLDALRAVDGQKDLLQRFHKDGEEGVASVIAQAVDKHLTRAEERLFDELAAVSIEQMDRDVRPRIMQVLAAQAKRDAD